MSAALAIDAVADSGTEGSAVGDRLRILLIDDDPAFSELCGRYLSRSAGPAFDVVFVANAAEGLAACQTESFDCLLIDYTLPDLRGTVVFRRIADVLGEFVPPAIVLTADGGETAAAEAIRAGAADFLPKHLLSPGVLCRAIENAVTKSVLRSSMEMRSRQLEQANQQLRSKNDEIQRFYHTISHEVKTPLAAAREFIALVLDGIVGPVTDEQVEMLTHAIDSCDQITSHFNDLVEMTRLDTRKIILKKQTGSLDNVVTRCLASISATLEAKNIALEKQIDEPLPLVMIDGNRIIQVMSNLLGNAVKFTPPNGRIRLAITRDADDGYVRISISDSGCGIADDHLPYIFDRLYQVKEGGDELMGAGLGLGLSIAKEIVSLHDGDMSATSTPGEGSDFVFRLPVAKSIFDSTETKDENRTAN